MKTPATDLEIKRNRMYVKPVEPTRTASPTQKRTKIKVPPTQAKILLRLLIRKLLLLTYDRIRS